MLGIGIDWAEEFHDVALGRPGEGVFDEIHVDHTPAALDALIARIVTLEPDPAEVRVVLETLHGLLVERLLKLLDRWPTHTALAAASPDELDRFARSCHHGWPDRFAATVASALATDQLTAKPYLARAKADTIRLAAAQLLLIHAQRRSWEQRMSELLLGAPRTPRAREAGDEPGPTVPDGEIYLSFAGLGVLLAARVAAEIGDIATFADPSALQCYAGKAPVTRRSGKCELTVAHRLACNQFLADAVQQWAFTSLIRSGWAREFYDEKVAVGNNHHKALRALGNRWLEILWHCLTKGVAYDEATHVANRNRALGRLNQPSKQAA